MFANSICNSLAKNLNKYHTMNEIIIKNPLTSWIRDSVIASKDRLLFAVPFLSSFAKRIVDEQTTKEIADKRIITRFDETSLTTFDLPTIKKLLDLGFSIQFDNSIHLKLYITDNEAYVTSSNLTQGGFEKNVELTVKTDSSNIQNCIDIFNDIWSNCTENILTYDLINSNWAKYEVLRIREKYINKVTKGITIKSNNIEGLNLEMIVDEVLNQNVDYSQTNNLVYEANKLRDKTKRKLQQSYNPDLFYVPEWHEQRRENLFFDFVYGYECKLAGTGLRELQFKTAFEHPDFEKVINYIYPDMLGMKSWNLNDKEELQKFCNGIFSFNIPQYTESLPIRLASYFYPEFFLPIFKMEHLKRVCEYLGLETKVESKGDMLFVYNSFLADKLKAIPYNNYIKSDITYLLLFTIELYDRSVKGELYHNILNDYKKKWIKDYIVRGKGLLDRLGIIE